MLFASRSRRTVSLLSVGVALFLSGATGIGLASPAVALSSAEVSSTPSHIWVDPTVRNVDNKYEWSVTLHMPPITSHAVIHTNVVCTLNAWNRS